MEKCIYYFSCITLINRRCNPKEGVRGINFIVSLQSMKIGQSAEVYSGHFLQEISI